MVYTDNWLEHEHSLYEDLVSVCLESAQAEDWETVDLALRDCVTHLKRHMALEEEVLFPAYEASAGAPQGPTMALRREHDDIARLIQDTVRVLGSQDREAVLDSLQLLESRMIKHHEKEEDIFLPMASHILRGSRDQLMQLFADSGAPKSGRKWDI